MRGNFKVFALILAVGVIIAVPQGQGGEGPFKTSALGLYVSAAASATGSFGPGVGLLLSWKEAPLLGLTWSFSEKRQNVGAFLDWRMAEGVIEKTPLRYYLGVGGYGGVGFGEDDTDFALGVRVPIGIRYVLAKQWELFLQGVPMLGVLPSLALRLGADLGFKYHF